MKLKDVSINYRLLAQAMDYYESLGYTQVEVPWLVDSPFSMATCPDEKYAFKVESNMEGKGLIRHLVGSAEQGFLSAMHEGRINPYQKYYSISPCFRADADTDIHAEQFVKLELFECSEDFFMRNVGEAHAYYNSDIKLRWKTEMLVDAMNLFERLGLEKREAVQVDNNDPYDVLPHGNTIHSFDLYSPIKDTDVWIEVGSYGLRRFEWKKMYGTIYQYYNYGTGLALPRFQLVI